MTERERPSSASHARARCQGAAAASPASRGDSAGGAYRRPLSSDPSRNRGPPSTDSSPGPKFRSAEYSGAGGEGRRAERERSGDEENRYPRGASQHKFAPAPRAEESGDEISDIDARLNALQSFLQVCVSLCLCLAPGRALLASCPFITSYPFCHASQAAKAKAKAAGGSRGR